MELGLRAPNWPEITIRYDHEFRWGQKDSTVWGDTNLTGLLPPYNSTRKIVPSFRNIDEKRDILICLRQAIRSATRMFSSGCGTSTTLTITR